MDLNSRILIVGHNNVIEQSLFRYLHNGGYANAVSASAVGLDYYSLDKVRAYFKKEQPEYVFLASTRSGGIGANQKFPAEFMYSNLVSQNNIIHTAYEEGAKKLMFFAGSCVYPKEAAQPMSEECLLTGPVEPTSEPYSIAKIAGIKMCQAYRRQYGFDAIVVIPATIYGPGSDADLETAHVMGALIGKFHAAVQNKQSQVEVWGTGNARREFLFADDFARACLFLMDNYAEEQVINAGYGKDVSINDLARLVADAAGFKGKIVFDSSKPDGAMRKLLDSRRISHLGWKPSVDLKAGIEETYRWYISGHKSQVT